MSPNDPNRTTDLPVDKPSHDPAATTDQSRYGTSADTNDAGQQNICSYKSLGTADGVRSSTVVPAIPDYEIEGELGRGGMGVVYRARQTTLNRLVAIKMILGGRYTDPMAQARFLIEAEVIAAIQHPHIVQLHQFGRHDDQPFFVLEYVGGGSLAGKLKTAGRFAPRDAAMMVAKLADGMAAAHQKGVVHRDLKPANVLLSEAGEPKITDFGLAKTGQSEMTVTGAVMGTPNYMSPEQAAGKTREVGTPTDIYSLGAILYELTTGRRPFRGESEMAIIQQVLTREPERLRAIDAKIPPDLETICLKCLEKDAKKRYATAVELSTELHAFLEGRPITARPVGLLERTWKWAKRNPAWTAGIAGGLLLLTVATVIGFAIRAATHAAGLVQTVLNANTAQVPAIIDGMADYRRWTDPLLREENDKAAVASRQRLHTSLALLPVDAMQVNYLYERLLDATPQEVPVIRDALAPHKDELLDKLWAVVDKPEKGKEPQRLRAASALAKYDPESQRWAKVQEAVVNDLVNVPAVYLAVWMDVLRPVRLTLLAPLSVVFASIKSGDFERSLATDILAVYAADNAQVLADLVMDANEKQFAAIFPKLKDCGEQGLPVLIGEIDKKLPPDLPSSDGKRETLAKRQANAAVALFRMNQPKKVWPLLKHSPDPRVRSYLIDRLYPLGANVAAIVQRLDDEPDVTIRRALLLSLGEFTELELSPEARQSLLPKLQDMYRTNADPGLHAAAEWLLRTWKQVAWLTLVNDEWAKDEEQRKYRLESFRQLVTKGHEKTPPQWYVNGQGQTMVVIPGPVEFMMGSPPTEADRNPNEVQHKKRIGRTIALAAHLVTWEQYLTFAPADKDEREDKYSPTIDCPANYISWYMATSYCNWLSKREGLPESEWCYEPMAVPQTVAASTAGLIGSPFGPGALLATCGLYPGRRDAVYDGRMKLAANYLQLAGYRLPTEAEMEYAIRAGAVTCRYYGETEDLLAKYTWYAKNGREHSWPVGCLKPNDLGFFDAQGNLFTWCQESNKANPTGKTGEAFEDKEDGLVIDSTRSRALRGGSFFIQPSLVRSASRHVNVPTNRFSNYGFRPARTLPLDRIAALPHSP